MKSKSGCIAIRSFVLSKNERGPLVGIELKVKNTVQVRETLRTLRKKRPKGEVVRIRPFRESIRRELNNFRVVGTIRSVVPVSVYLRTWKSENISTNRANVFAQGNDISPSLYDIFSSLGFQPFQYQRIVYDSVKRYHGQRRSKVQSWLRLLNVSRRL